MTQLDATGDKPHNQAEDVAFDYIVPDVSVWKARYLWKASFCVLGLCLFCETPHLQPL